MAPAYPRLLTNAENPLPAPGWWEESDGGEVQFAYWVPNVSGGLVITTLPMQTGWDLESNLRYAKVAEENGFAAALSQTRWFASYGADHQHEAFVISSQILAHTERLHLITAVHPGLWHPGVVAKMQASLDVVSGGRTAINVVSGWFRSEFTGYGLPWLEHDERYRRSEEFVRVLKGMWTEDVFDFYGAFYTLEEAPMLPKPVHRIPVFQGGNSKAARRMAGCVSDVLFMNGNTNRGFREIIADARAAAEAAGRDPRELKFGANGFAIVRDTEDEAVETLREIVANADVEAVKGFGEATKAAGRSSREGEGMWADSSFEDLVQYNDGFKTGLIGTPEQVAERILELKDLGVDIILCGFLHYDWELEQFGRKVIPLVREREEARRNGSYAAGRAR
ncbi:luciferase-like protein [Rubrobacter xylanophilus DSM 9941]|uniref:Luciferase-like protein n=1 Tax=Rubrobacter xylanophilus (strain DSM 9941 / JCM 11954 / NBRC 16129 / PRD-1) TaxID=266117 RepID=Q1AV35_RUBXD|nr:dimethyl sulfone monooxygenase SfnG [Rubrobacter xylanophilus]ABG04743.1 luciferase-like protein [Rubrobacter xylanophilus DSM 9941]